MYRITGYSLQFQKSGTKQWTVFDTVKTSNRRLDGLKPGTAYMVRLKSNNPYGASEPSEMVEFKTLESKCHSVEETSALMTIYHKISYYTIQLGTLHYCRKLYVFYPVFYLASFLLFSLVILRVVSA